MFTQKNDLTHKNTDRCYFKFMSMVYQYRVSNMGSCWYSNQTIKIHIKWAFTKRNSL